MFGVVQHTGSGNMYKPTDGNMGWTPACQIDVCQKERNKMETIPVEAYPIPR